MAKEKPTNDARGNPGKDKPEYTTFRLYADDGENLSELAGKRNTTIADLYRDLFAETVRKLLIEETERRLKQLKNG